MSIHLNIPQRWKPEGLSQIFSLSEETNQPISQWIWEAARELAAHPQVFQENIK